MRRVVPHKEAEFSSHSIMKAMERFVQAVQDMDETILVPSRLMDLEVGDASDTVELKPKGMSTDLYRLYMMVNCVKNELLWGANSGEVDEEEPITTVATSLTKGHTRRPSTASVASTQSATLSDTDSEMSNENDSGIEGESESKPDYTRSVETSFRRHLYGLQRSLRQMTAAAAYLTKRYQSDIGANL
ncbi:mid1-interacting protein 1-B isoform X2 [Cimex lectularius]|nr:mid1-interacting protein 1-B isoform X2 [Cimex lectularius]